ncbi:MAG: hypothetical protein H6662_15635 [Ardenticatenaceae bacterium]|nr:hypothetical protein [Anaerolineales bacterium]MCB8923019.1 hypothetical protein [Ardenticatenaceae bacterium]
MTSLTKPGVKTSEFWLTLMPWLLALVVVILLGLGRVDIAFAQWVLVALGIGGGVGNAAYANGRAKVKSVQ